MIPPAPWKTALEINEDAIAVFLLDANAIPVAHIRGYYDNSTKDTAHAISAVPEMLEALEAVKEWIEVMGWREEKIFESDLNPDAQLDLQNLLVRDARKVYRALAKAEGKEVDT